MRALGWFCALGLMGVALPANAQIMANRVGAPGQNRAMAGAFFSMPEIEYEWGNDDFEVDRKVLGAELLYPVASRVGLIGQVGVIIDSEVSPGNVDDGKGFILGAGLQGEFYRSGAMRAMGHGFFNYVSEQWDLDPRGEVELSLYDIHAGALMAYTQAGRLEPYVGLDLALVSDGDVKIKPSGAKDDVEREDTLNLFFGTTFALDSALLRIEAAVIGEEKFTFAADFPI